MRELSISFCPTGMIDIEEPAYRPINDVWADAEAGNYLELPTA
jgi:hypothetical protein